MEMRTADRILVDFEFVLKSAESWGSPVGGISGNIAFWWDLPCNPVGVSDGICIFVSPEAYARDHGKDPFEAEGAGSYI